MVKDKYTAVWVSHSSISDFLACPRAYYLNNIYRNPKTGHKIKLMSPPLALGQAVHEVIESLSVLETSARFHDSLLDKFDSVWKKVTGKRGGFFEKESEERYKKRGQDMMRRVMNNPGPLKNLAVKINMDLPYYWLSEEENIILCGKVDWLEYLADADGVHIIDFKTSKGEESDDSLQLAIYALLVTNCQKRKATKASYWYLDRHDYPLEKKLPSLKESEEKILKIAKDIKLARQLERFVCPTDGCRACQNLEKVVKGEGELVGADDFGQDIFILRKPDEMKEDSRIL